MKYVSDIFLTYKMEKLEATESRIEVQATAQETSDVKREAYWFCTQIIWRRLAGFELTV